MEQRNLQNVYIRFIGELLKVNGSFLFKVIKQCHLLCNHVLPFLEFNCHFRKGTKRR